MRTLLISVIFFGFSQIPKNAIASSETEEPTLLTNTRQLTYDGKRSGEGYFSADGKHLIFQSEREPDNPFYQIYTLDLESGDSKRVSPGIGKTTCAFFQPKTNRALFASTHLDPEAKSKQTEEIEFRASGKKRRYSWDYDEHMDIFSANRDGTELTRLTDAPGYDAEAAYSPDGKKIVFCSLRSAYPPNALSASDQKKWEVDPAYFGEIYIMNADGSEQTRLTHTPGYDGGPFFSADGERIVWRRFDESGMIANVFTMDLDGTNVVQVTDFQSMSWAPYFHPSGEYIIFASNKYGFENFELFLVDAEGQREPIRVTTKDGFDGLPVFSPNGKMLCWTSKRNQQNQSQLYLGNWNHNAALEALEKAPKKSKSEPQPQPKEKLLTIKRSPEISVEDLKKFVEEFSSDDMEGRLTGTPANKKAARYLASHLEAIGLSPLGDDNSFFQEFEFTADIQTAEDGNQITVKSGASEKTFSDVSKDFAPLAFTVNSEVSGQVAFAGYGLSVPGDMETAYNSYAGLDVKDKIVLVLRYVPEEISSERRQELNRYAGLRYKAMIAREKGAKAILIVTGPNSPNAGKLVRHSFDTSLSNSGIIAASISLELAEAIVAGSGKTLKQLQTALDTENPHTSHGILLENTELTIATKVTKIKKTDRNVLAYSPPHNNDPHAEYILIGAHYDHLGLGDHTSLAHKGEEHTIHNGADDNASGVALLLEIAAKVAQDQQTNKLQNTRGVIYAFWSGEELGLLGSSHFARNPPLPLSFIKAYLNFDMIGRLKENKLVLQGVGSSLSWKKLIEKRNIAAGFDLVLQEDPYLPTDSTAFYPNKIPVLNFFTGSHEDYHRPTDTAEKLNYEGLARITNFAYKVINDITTNTDAPDYVKVEKINADQGNRDQLRVYLGTIPDYTTEVQGVKLSGVRGGGPADKAGLQGGDIITQLAGREITNIYDYTYALNALKIGETVEITVQRKEDNINPLNHTGIQGVIPIVHGKYPYQR